MEQKHRDYLVDKFPFFEPNMSFDCGDGWFRLLKKLCKGLNALQVENLKIRQVKEKFGILRVYFNSRSLKATDTAMVLLEIMSAEKMSSIICEMCGKPGEARENKRWITVRCARCREKYS